MKKLLITIGSLVVLVVVALSLFGIVPVLSSVLGAGPKDLGIRYNKEDSAAAWQKSGGTEIVSLPKGTPVSEDFRLEGKKDAKFTMDSKELTAHSNNRPWKNYPVKNLQIKIHDDGSIEASAILVISKALPYAMGLGYSEQQIKDAMSKYNIPPFEVPIYIYGKGSVHSDNVSVDAKNVKIGAVTVPGNIVEQANAEAESVLDDVIRKHSNAFHADEVSFDRGIMTFVGQVPVKEYVITE